jgi:UDP-glucose 4-epimerase
MNSTDVILVTGADGLLGRRVVEYASKYSKICAVVHAQPKKPILDVDYLVVDLSKDWNPDVLPKKVSSIIHLAQSSNFRDFPDSALDVFGVNVATTARLLDYARKADVQSFVYASSGGVYGNGSEAFKENAPIVPPGQLGYYLGSKACGEILVQSYASIFQVVILRPFFMYGPGQNRSMLIPRLMDSVATGKHVTLQGTHGLRINPVHVDDAAQAVLAALKLKASATFNIAGPDVISIREICEGMGEYLKTSPKFIQQDGFANDLIADISAMKSELFSPERSLMNCFSEINLPPK